MILDLILNVIVIKSGLLVFAYKTGNKIVNLQACLYYSGGSALPSCLPTPGPPLPVPLLAFS